MVRHLSKTPPRLSSFQFTLPLSITLARLLIAQPSHRVSFAVHAEFPVQSGHVDRIRGTSSGFGHTFSLSIPIHCCRLTPWSARSSTSSDWAQSCRLGSPPSLMMYLKVGQYIDHRRFRIRNVGYLQLRDNDAANALRLVILALLHNSTNSLVKVAVEDRQ